MAMGGNKKGTDSLAHSIIVPTDFSAVCTNAALYAKHLFEAEQHKLVLINTYENPDLKANLLVSLSDILSKESEKGLRLQSEKIMARLPGSGTIIETYSEEGGIKAAMQEIIKKENVDILSIGIHDHSTYVGPLKLRIPFTLKPHLPLLLVPENASFRPPKKIALISSEHIVTDKTIKNIPILHTIIEKYKCNIATIETDDDIKPGSLANKIQGNVLLHKFDMAVIIVSTDDVIDKILQGHMLDDIYSTVPTLLIRHN
jgi:hypothetical protein